MRKRFCFIDLDGTLLSKTKKISNNNLEAIKNFVDDINHIVICTGRWPISASKFNYQIEKFSNIKNKYLIAMNGSFIKDLQNDKIIHESFLRQDVFEKLLIVQKKFRVPMWIYSKDGVKNKIIYSLNIPLKKIVSKFNYGTVIDYNKNECNNNSIYKILFISMNAKKINKLYSWLKENFSDYLSIIKTSSKNIEITSSNTNKGTAIQLVSNLENLSINDIYTFGDSGNDISMFKKSGHRFAFSFKNTTLNKFASLTFSNNKNLYTLFSKIKNNEFDNNYLKDRNVKFVFNNVTSLSDIISVANQNFLWGYLINQNNCSLIVESLPNWTIKKIFNEFLINKNLNIVSANSFNFYSVKEKKFIFAKSFSDTQILKIKEFINRNSEHLKTIIIETKNEIILIYKNEKLLKDFLSKYNLLKSDFSQIERFDLCNINQYLSNVLTFSVWGLSNNFFHENFDIVSIDNIYSFLNKKEKKDSPNKNVEQFTNEFIINQNQDLGKINNCFRELLSK